MAVVILSSLLFAAIVNFSVVFCWSNGGYSDDPSDAEYGTHDWIAHHALDWLPLTEKQFVLDNLANYLYGTELPDNGGAPDGIGDRFKHHVYYSANGFLQDDASAVRAQEEYSVAVDFFMLGDLANATKRLGVMTHYIVDLAVFGHVMSPNTDWGDEIHHSDYEAYVNTRTDSYHDEFNTFLVFDGVLNHVSAYDAALTLAYDTTFDVDGAFTCVWMDQNYNWSSPTFKNRCTESLNLAVNLVADVLHTFYLEMQGTTHFIIVPFHYQDTDYYCGPACLEMIFDYYGEDINQSEIADVARTFPYVTFTDELRRAAHFSNISTSKGGEMPENITGYSLRKIGYAASESFNMDLTQLKSHIDQDKPLILLMWYSTTHVYGHYRVVTGYNETHVFLHDPWNNIIWGGRYGGASLALNYSTFLDLWSYYDNWTLCVSPWTVNVSAPTYIRLETPFQIDATIAYPQALQDALDNYPASSCNATITLPANLTLAPGETSRKTVGTSILEAGANSTVGWMLRTNSSAVYTVTVEVEGLVSGSVWSHNGYPAYTYSDRIGVEANFSMELHEDNNAPIISIPSRIPEGQVQPNQEVEISVNITDLESGVKNATIYYNLNSSQTWVRIVMDCNSTSTFYNVTIPGQPEETYVRYRIVAFDEVGNNATLDGTEPYCVYQVIPEFPSFAIIPLFMTAILLAAIVYGKKRSNYL